MKDVLKTFDNTAQADFFFSGVAHVVSNPPAESCLVGSVKGEDMR